MNSVGYLGANTESGGGRFGGIGGREDGCRLAGVGVLDRWWYRCARLVQLAELDVWGVQGDCAGLVIFAVLEFELGREEQSRGGGGFSRWRATYHLDGAKPHLLRHLSGRCGFQRAVEGYL